MGDAPGGLTAARTHGALFFLIHPGYEEQSWERCYRQGIDWFFKHTFTGGYEATLMEKFEKLLPEKRPWKSRG